MAKTKYAINEKSLSKGELRKLNALRKSVGDDLGNEAFSKWYETARAVPEVPSDRNIEVIRAALEPHINELKFPRGSSYVVKRGRGRIVVEPVTK